MKSGVISDQLLCFSQVAISGDSAINNRRRDQVRVQLPADDSNYHGISLSDQECESGAKTANQVIISTQESADDQDTKQRIVSETATHNVVIEPLRLPQISSSVQGLGCVSRSSIKLSQIQNARDRENEEHEVVVDEEEEEVREAAESEEERYCDTLRETTRRSQGFQHGFHNDTKGRFGGGEEVVYKKDTIGEVPQTTGNPKAAPSTKPIQKQVIEYDITKHSGSTQQHMNVPAEIDELGEGGGDATHFSNKSPKKRAKYIKKKGRAAIIAAADRPRGEDPETSSKFLNSNLSPLREQHLKSGELETSL